MSKATELATKLDKTSGCLRWDEDNIVEAAAHLRALDASHRQLLEALEACLKKGARWHICDPVVINADAAIATAKDLT